MELRLNNRFMTLGTICALLVSLTGCAAGELAAPERHYKILMLLPVGYESHRTVFMPLAEALADRGHKIVILTNKPKSSKHPNILEVNHGLQLSSARTSLNV
nr:uncharacterized protein LOC128691073 [Cherax quadricarinatus]